MQIGVQMYSLRNYIPKAGLQETLEKVKQAGFDCIEPICYDYDIGYENVGKLMRKFGLCAHSMHIPYEVVANKAELQKMQDVFKIQTAVIPCMSGEDLSNTAKLTDMLGLASDNARALGLQLAYHNHAHEFDNGGSPARLCTLCPDLKLQVDVFWVKAAGLTPIDFLQNNAQCVWGVHMKEIGASAQDPEPIVGSGQTDAKAVLAFAKAQGHKSITLEYEHVAIDEIEYITESLRYMRENVQ